MLNLPDLPKPLPDLDDDADDDGDIQTGDAETDRLLAVLCTPEA